MPNIEILINDEEVELDAETQTPPPPPPPQPTVPEPEPPEETTEGRFKVFRLNVGEEEQGIGRRRRSSVGRRNRKISAWEYDTYDPRFIKSFAQITSDALPNLDNYQEMVGNGVSQRPTIEDLHDKDVQEKPPEIPKEEAVELKGKVIKFSWLEGVLMRCLLNIWGVMLFLRLTWIVGQAGVWQGLIIISMANLVTFITGFSLSAVSTNGVVKGGGIYYMTSRSLGPAFGAAIGLMFTLANSIAVSLHVVGFCESVNDLFKQYEVGPILDGGLNSIRVVGVGTVICILILAFVGMDWVTRTQMFLLFVLIAAQIDVVIGSFMGPQNDEESAKGFSGYDGEIFKENFNSGYKFGFGDDNSPQDFFSVFGVFFPSVTGIVAGANLSGDLKDPSSAIPKGTLLAITITYVSYIIYTFMIGGTVYREADGNVTSYLQTMECRANSSHAYCEGLIEYNNCDNRECDWGLLNNAQIMELISGWGPLIYMGCFAATLSSAIASLVGAPRVLQALAKDRLYPYIHIFSKGYGANNDPVRGYILVFSIAVGCLLIAKLNVIAPLLSNFFLSAYCLINFSVFHASITKSPGWRPSFKYYSAWVSLGGSLLCIVTMFLLNWVTALITVGVSITLYLYVTYKAPPVNWGSSFQMQKYNTALKSVQDLAKVEEHVKTYRPQLLILSGFPSSRTPLMDFGRLITKDMSLIVCGHVLEGEYSQGVRNALRKEAYTWLAKHKIKGFYSVVEEDALGDGCRSIMQLVGLGRLRPNMVLMGYKSDWELGNNDLWEYVNVIHECLNMHLSIGILRVREGLDYSSMVEEDGSHSLNELLTNKSLIVRSNSMMPQGDTEGEKKPKMTKQDKKEAKKVEEKKISYKGRGGQTLDVKTMENLTQFTTSFRPGTIDVWWLFDDGGLTVLVPYIISQRSLFSECHLRIFTISAKKDELESEQKKMASMLSKFRIQVGDLIMVPDVVEKAKDSTQADFDALIEPFLAKDGDEDEDGITERELRLLRAKTNYHMRIRESVAQHSKNASFLFMTLPVPRKGSVSAPLYMAWLETMTKDITCPVLYVRGNQTPVLTFYS